MAEILADLANGHAVFEQVSGEAMSQGVAGRVLLEPQLATAMRIAFCTELTLIGLLDSPMAAAREWQRSFQPRPTPGKDPLWVAMRFPITAESLDHRRGNRYFAVLAALASRMRTTARARRCLRDEAEPPRRHAGRMMDERENGSEATLANRAEQASGLFASQNDRQRVVAPDLELLPELPVVLEGNPGRTSAGRRPPGSEWRVAAFVRHAGRSGNRRPAAQSVA